MWWQNFINEKRNFSSEKGNLKALFYSLEDPSLMVIPYCLHPAGRAINSAISEDVNKF